jgi:eukaryotic-like serine/threonine-protein kinase
VPGGHIPDPSPTFNGASTGAWVLDRFQLRRELHAGATGELWLARERDTRELVAARIGIGPVRRERAEREGRVLERVVHEGIPRLVAQGPIDGGWCVVAEHVDGAPLSKLLRVTSPAPPRAIAWTRQLAAALIALHAAGIVHGDLHPGNVILARDGAGRDRMVLVGFGVAAIDGEWGFRAASPHTAAPEVVRGECPTARTDVYAIGIVLYRMLVERWPFAGTEQDVLQAQVGTPPPPLGRHTPSLRLPPGLEALVFRCLEKDPHDRYESAEALAGALAELAFLPHRDWVRVEGELRDDESTTGSVAPPVPRVEAPEHETTVGFSARIWAALAAFAGASGLAATAWWLW